MERHTEFVALRLDGVRVTPSRKSSRRVVWKTVGLNDTKRSFNHDFNGRLKRGIGRGGLWDGDEGRLGRL